MSGKTSKIIKVRLDPLSVYMQLSCSREYSKIGFEIISIEIKNSRSYRSYPTEVMFLLGLSFATQ